MGDRLMMKEKELACKAVFEQVKQGYITRHEAGKQLNLSYRQIKRKYKCYLKDGDVGLMHKSRGKASTRAYPSAYKEKIINCYQARYMNFGPTLAAEKLFENDGYSVKAETLRLWLKKAGLWTRKRQRNRYRQQRERRTRFGELVQLDGSIHSWFSKEQGRQCLINMVDDATGITMALLNNGETTAAALNLLKSWIKKYGIPQALYVDLKSVYVSPRVLKAKTKKYSASQNQWLTHFSYACRQLGIRIVKAYSPQAKGRVERSHAVYQDRFVKELELKGITTYQEANHLLQNGFIDNLNRKFAKPPADNEDAHTPLTSDVHLDQSLCWRHERKLKSDWTIQFDKQVFQLEKNPVLTGRGQVVTVKKLLDGTISIWKNNTQLAYHTIKNEKYRYKRVTKNAGDLSLRLSEIARRNKHKSPWGRPKPGWKQK